MLSSLTPWPSAPNSPLAGSTKVIVPTPETPSRSHIPSSHCPLSDSAGRSRSVSSFSPRRSRNAPSRPPSRAAAAIRSSAQRMSLSSIFKMRSPTATPASSAGETTPSAVTTSEKPETSTPSQQISTPTACPPTSSCSAQAPPGSSAKARKTIIADAILFFMAKISFPRDLSHVFQYARRGGK